MLNNLVNLKKKMRKKWCPPPPPGRDHGLEGRRSQGGLILKSLEFGLFAASNYKVDKLLSLIVTEVLSWVVRSSKNSISI